MAGEKRVIATKMIETQLDLYDSFFDPTWARTTAGLVPAPLSDAFDNLCLAWKEAANTHRLPWLMVTQMEAFAGGFMRRSKPDMAVLIGEFRDWVLKELDGELRRVEKKAITATVKKIEQRLRIASQSKDPRFPATQYWSDVIEQSEFQLSISGSQGLTYCGLVFGYEWFVVCCFRLLGGSEESRPGDKSFWAQFASMLGGDPKAVYWDDLPVKVAREARNSLAHLGGKQNSKLQKLTHGLYISREGILSVQPVNNRDLFGVLKAKVTQLINALTLKLAVPAAI